MTQAISNLAVGSKVKFGNYSVEAEAAAPIIWKVADKNHTGYPANSVTLMTERIIDLRGFDALEPNNADANRKLYGNNRYLYANLRKWLNISGLPWWTASQSADATPNDTGMAGYLTGYDDKKGFLSNFTADELAAILDTTLTVAKNTITDSGGSETVIDKLFLPSTTEVGLANENSIVEGSILSLFSANTDALRIAYPTQALVTNTLSTSKPASTTAAWYYWLRTPYSGNSYNARYVHTSGALRDNSAYNGNIGVRPLCNLSSAILVSDTVDSDGCYQTIFTMPYVITLDKPITLTAGTALPKLKFAPQINAADMTLKEMDSEKIIYTKADIGTTDVTLKISGTDAKIDKVAYTVS